MLEDKVEKLLKSGSKIEAIQYLHKQEGWSLKDAKDYVDQYATEYNVDAKNTSTTTSKKAENRGCMVVLLFNLVIFGALFVLIAPPSICRATEILHGRFGLFFWLFLEWKLIIVLLIVNIWAWVGLIKSQTKRKQLGKILVFAILLVFFTAITDKEAVTALKDITATPVEVTITNYTVEGVYRTTGRSGSRRLCYRININNSEYVEYVLVPLKTVKNRSITPSMPKEITIFVYPNSGVVADRESLKELSSFILKE